MRQRLWQLTPPLFIEFFSMQPIELCMQLHKSGWYVWMVRLSILLKVGNCRFILLLVFIFNISYYCESGFSTCYFWGVIVGKSLKVVSYDCTVSTWVIHAGDPLLFPPSIKRKSIKTSKVWKHSFENSSKKLIGLQ